MKNYKNNSGDSIVKAFQIYDDAIKIQFTDESIHLYTYEKSGKRAVDTMKVLASEHHGLGNFIKKNTDMQSDSPANDDSQL